MPHRFHELITTGQAAPLLGCSARTVVRWIEQGRLTPVAQLPGPKGPFLLDLADVERLAKETASA